MNQDWMPDWFWDSIPEPKPPEVKVEAVKVKDTRFWKPGPGPESHILWIHPKVYEDIVKAENERRQLDARLVLGLDPQ